jgi:hypothetical protein
MDKPEVSGFTFPCLPVMTVKEDHCEERIVMSRVIVLGPSSEFLISRHEGGGDVMSEKMRLGIDMQKLNNIVMPDDTATACLGKGFCWNNLPVVVGIGVAISGDLLT